MTIALHRFLLPTLLLSAACGLPPESSPSASPEAPTGQLESALCSGASVSGLTVQGASSYGGELGAAGTWTVSNANAVRLEFRVDGQSQAESERPSASGTWNHSSLGIGCGSHTLQVRAWPMVIDSAGNRTTCTQNPTVISYGFTQDCPSASMRCLQTSRYQVTCTGSSGGGTGSLSPLWQQQVRLPQQWDWHLNQPWYEGDWTQTVYCEAPVYASLDDAQVLVEFKARDSSGMESPVASQILYCLTNSVEQPY